MQFSKLATAMAVCNLRNLGYSAEEAIDISSEWARRQSEQSLEKIEANLHRSLRCIDSLNLSTADMRGTMFASCHFSLYPIIFGALSQRSSSRRVMSLIGMQSRQHQDVLKLLAAKFDVALTFVPSGFRMLRQMQQALADGHCGVVLIDIPWSTGGGDLDAKYPAFGGHFLARSNLYRLIDLIDPSARFLLVRRDGDSFRIDDHGVADATSNYRSFAHALKKDPAEYERLHEFHKFFSFDRIQNIAAHFEVRGEGYIISAQTMKAWKLAGIPKPQYGTILKENKDLERYRKVTDHDISEIIAL